MIMKFKVYVDYTTEEVPRPFYVGKGTDKRVMLEARNKLHTAIKTKYGVDRRIVFESDSEQEALELECQLIAEHNTYVYGGGWGANFTLGGEGTSGAKRDHHGEKHPMWGKRHTEEAKHKNSESNRIACAGERNGMFGKQHSEETRKKIGDNQRGWHHTEESKAKIAAASSRLNKGRKMSEETKQKIATARKGKAPWNKGKTFGAREKPRVYSEQARKNISDGCKGRVPWNKGKNSTNTLITEPVLDTL